MNLDRRRGNTLSLLSLSRTAFVLGPRGSTSSRVGRDKAGPFVNERANHDWYLAPINDSYL